MRRLMVLALALAGCAGLARSTNGGAQAEAEAERRSQEADAESWQGAELLSLETHPFFSTQPRNVAELSDGSQLWGYTSCRNNEVPIRCATFPIGSVAFTNCSGGKVEQSCCVRQFRVRDNTVESFRAIGPCLTGCRFRQHACAAS